MHRKYAGEFPRSLNTGGGGEAGWSSKLGHLEKGSWLRTVVLSVECGRESTSVFKVRQLTGDWLKASVTDCDWMERVGEQVEHGDSGNSAM